MLRIDLKININKKLYFKMGKFKKLCNRSYKSIINRGLIDGFTKDEDFYNKILEESKEVFESIMYKDNISKKEEVTDLMDVCINYLIWQGVEPIEELEKCVIKNENRAKNEIQQK